MAQEKQTFQRRTDPLYAKLRNSGKFLDSLVDNESVFRNALAVAGESKPDQGDVLEAALPGAIEQAEVRQRPIPQRKQAAYNQRREPRTPAGRAAAGLLSEEQGETAEAGEAGVDPEAVKALMSEWTEAEKEAVHMALVEEASEASRLSLEDEEAAEERSLAARDEALGFSFDDYADDATLTDWAEQDGLSGFETEDEGGEEE